MLAQHTATEDGGGARVPQIAHGCLATADSSDTSDGGVGSRGHRNAPGIGRSRSENIDKNPTLGGGNLAEQVGGHQGTGTLPLLAIFYCPCSIAHEKYIQWSARRAPSG